MRTKLDIYVFFYRSIKIDRLIDWCLTPTLAIFQLYRGVKIDSHDATKIYIYKSCQTNDYGLFGVLFEMKNDRGHITGGQGLYPYHVFPRKEILISHSKLFIMTTGYIVSQHA